MLRANRIRKSWRSWDYLFQLLKFVLWIGSDAKNEPMPSSQDSAKAKRQSGLIVWMERCYYYCPSWGNEQVLFAHLFEGKSIYVCPKSSFDLDVELLQVTAMLITRPLPLYYDWLCRCLVVCPSSTILPISGSSAQHWISSMYYNLNFAPLICCFSFPPASVYTE